VRRNEVSPQCTGRGRSGQGEGVRGCCGAWAQEGGLEKSPLLVEVRGGGW